MPYGYYVGAIIVIPIFLTCTTCPTSPPKSPHANRHQGARPGLKGHRRRRRCGAWGRLGLNGRAVRGGAWDGLGGDVCRESQ